jgi:hypothetical protein
MDRVQRATGHVAWRTGQERAITKPDPGHDVVAERLRQHLNAGADHVLVGIITEPNTLISALTELAGPLGLQHI